MGIFDFIATIDFVEEEFFELIDIDQRLDDQTRQSFWDEYSINSEQNLITFYRSLDDSMIPQYVKQSMNHFFYLKALEYLGE